MHPTTPSAPFDIAAFGELVGDPSRAAMLLSLMDGLARPASELAQIARVTPSTASSHLSRLQGGGLLLVEQRGRHRYFRLASDDVAHAIEVIALHTSRARKPAAPDPERARLAHARTCYKHLAGEVGVAWLATLEERKLLRIRDGALSLAPRGVARFEELGVEVPDWPPGKPCLDWTERRNHLGGPLGGLLTQALFELGSIVRRKDGRAIRITARGRSGFAGFGLALRC